MLSFFYKPAQAPTTHPATSPSITQNTSILILTSEGGRGHIDAARKVQQDYQKKGKESLIIHVNQGGWYTFQYSEKYGTKWLPFIGPWIDHNFATDSITAWNEAQKNCDLAMQRKIVSWQTLANTLFGPNFFEKMKTLLQNNPQIDLVVSTQPMAISAIFSAISTFNRTRLSGEKTIQFKLVFTDMPTPDAIHFLQSIANIKEKDFDYANLILDIPYPAIPASHLCINDYHKKFATICSSLYQPDEAIPKSGITINFNMGPIDQKFEELFERCKKETSSVVISELRKKTIPIQFTQTARKKYAEKLPHMEQYVKNIQDVNTLIRTELTIPFHGHIMTLMLGSQASIEGTLSIIDMDYELHKNYPLSQPTYLFVFCGDDLILNSLFDKVCEKAKNYYIENKFIVIPLTNQNKETISLLYLLAHTSIIRPGGLSVMEQAITSRSVPERYIFIYAEKDPSIPAHLTMKDPKTSLFQWEKGNAESLEIHFGTDYVSIVNIDTYKDKRKKQYLGEDKLSLFYQIKENQTLKKYLDKDLAEFCSFMSLTTNDVYYNANHFMIGCAIFNAQYTSIAVAPIYSSAMILYGFSYDYACHLIMNNKTQILFSSCETIQHPSNWALRFANFIQTVYEKSKNSLQKNELTQKIKDNYPLAQAFVDAFYQENICILSEEEAFVYANAYLENDKNKDLAINVINKIHQQEANEIKSKNFPDAYHLLWRDGGATFSDKINSIIDNYINPPWGSFHWLRSQATLASQILCEAKKSPEEFLEYLIKVKNINGINASGSFMNRLLFIIEKTKEEIEKNHSQKTISFSHKKN